MVEVREGSNGTTRARRPATANDRSFHPNSPGPIGSTNLFANIDHLCLTSVERQAIARSHLVGYIVGCQAIQTPK